MDIPIPPSGYWTRLSFGKSVEKILLPDSLAEFVVLPNYLEGVIKKSANKEKAKDKANVIGEKKVIDESESGNKATLGHQLSSSGGCVTWLEVK